MNIQTFADLLTYVQLLKEPSDSKPLTDDSIYAIGLLHKSLPKNEKHWDVLAERLKFSSGESLRQFILRHQQKDEALAAINVRRADADLDTPFESDYKNCAQIRDVYNAYRASLRNDARVEALQKCLIECAQKQAELPVTLDIGIRNTASSSTEAVLLLGDWHIGQLVNNFYNKYDYGVAKQRISVVVRETINYCKRFNVARLNILNLGDLIEGIINVNGRINQQQDVCGQLMYASELLALALYQLQDAAPEVLYRSCIDNHSRLLADKQQNIAAENLNRLTDWYLETRLKNTKIKMPKDNLDLGFGKFKLLNGKSVVFFHGHEDSKNQVLQNVVGATQEWIDIVCCGHYHDPAAHTYQNMRLFVNNSLCGTGDYALSKRLFTKPSQKLIIADQNNIIDIDINVD